MSTVWIVEDNDMIRDCLASLLQMAGFQVSAFAEGGIALQGASENWPELVLLDLYTNAMSAQDFVDGLNALASQLSLALPKICVISGAAEIEEISRQLNADFFFQKPFNLLDLVQYTKKACGKTTDT